MRQIFYFTLTLSFILFTIVSNAQRSCNSMDVLERQIQEHPERMETMQQIERFIANYQETDGRNANVYTIPVVVHIVYRNGTQNISESQILSQIDVLNEDFRRLNSDANNTWPQAADSEIEFCMATVDPNGNPTNGITRTSTTRNVFTDDDKVKFDNQGGKDAWPADQYMNLWVCALDGFLGYAQFPGGPANTDGIVCDYRYFGTNGTAQAPFNLGRTATHEVGHWLNLYHIWGDGGCGVDDEVNDTPPSDAPNYGCTSNHTSCGNRDMVQNYMDYSDDACMNLFTSGQKNRMRALFANGGPRANLLNSAACGGGSSDTEAPTRPTNLTASNTTQTSTSLSWNASSDNVGVTGYNVYVDGTLVGTSANTNYNVGSLSAGTTYTMSVAAYDAAGNVSPQISITITTAQGGDTEAPTRPRNLTASNTTQTSTILSWSASTDNVGVSGYNVYVNGSLVGSSSNTSYNVNGLSAGTEYTMAVAAYDAAGNVSPQISISVTTLQGGGGGTADAGIHRIIHPKASSCLSTFKPRVLIRNYGTTTITSLTVNYSANGQSYSKQWTGSIAPRKYKTIVLDYISVSVGSHTFVASTSNPNGANDLNPNNDQKTKAFDVTGFDQVKVSVRPDAYGSEITWALTNDNGDVVASGGPYADNDTRTKNTSVCLQEGCYTFRIEDSYGDGICCEYGRGWYRIRSSRNTNIIRGNGRYGSFEEKSFCVGNSGARQIGENADVAIERSIDIMPNPASANVQIVVNEVKAGSTIRVINTLGQVMYQTEMNDSEAYLDLDVSTFENGIYIVQLDDGKKPLTKKLMVLK
ncbi:MAG: fibronectin type III domain-containing protein [Bacteroidota bacterium]